MLRQIRRSAFQLLFLGGHADKGVVLLAAALVTLGQPDHDTGKQSGQRDGTKVAVHRATGKQIRQVHAFAFVGGTGDPAVTDPAFLCLQRKAQKHAQTKAEQYQSRTGQTAGEVGQHARCTATGKGHTKAEHQTAQQQTGVDRVHPQIHLGRVLFVQKRGGCDGGGNKHQHQRAHQAGGTGAVSAVYTTGKAQRSAGQGVSQAQTDQQTEKDG